MTTATAAIKKKNKAQIFKGFGSLAAVIESARERHLEEERSMMNSLNRLGSKAAKKEVAAASAAKKAEPPKDMFSTPPPEDVKDEKEEKAGVIETQLITYDTFLTLLTARIVASDYLGAVLIIKQTVTHPKFPHGLRSPVFPLVNALADYIDKDEKTRNKPMTPLNKKIMAALKTDINDKLQNYSTILLNRREEQRIVNTQATQATVFPPIVEQRTSMTSVALLVLTSTPIEAPYPRGVERVAGRVFLVSADLVGLPFFDPELALIEKKRGKGRTNAKKAAKGKKGRPVKPVGKAKPDIKMVEKAYAAEHRKAAAFAAKSKFNPPLEQRLFVPESDGVWFACLPPCFPHASVERITFPERAVVTDGVSSSELEAAMRKRNIARQKDMRIQFETSRAQDLAQIKRWKLQKDIEEANSKIKAEAFKDLMGLPPTTNVNRIKDMTNQRLRDQLAGEKLLSECIRIRKEWQIAFNRVMKVKIEYMAIRAKIKELKGNIDKKEAELAGARESFRLGFKKNASDYEEKSATQRLAA